MSADQEQAPVELQADFEKAMAAGDAELATFALRAIPALVAALKAATTKIARACGCTFNIKTLQREECSFHAELRADLARVERQAETDNEWLQARIAELEGSLRERDALLDDVHEWRTEPRTTASSG